MEVLHMSNISHLIPETFLVGPEDFAYEVVVHPTRLYAVLQRPWIFVRAILHTPFMTPVRVLVRDVHNWWVHANIEAFASANAREAVIQEAQAWAANINTDSNSTLDALNTLNRFSRGMSRHMTKSIWSYFFSHDVPTSASKYTARRRSSSPVDEHHEVVERRRQHHHELALGHAILHTPAAQTHWVPEESIAAHEKPSPQRVFVNTNTESIGIGMVSPATARSRSLLQFLDDTFVKRMNAVQAYSSEVALGDGVVQILPAVVTDEFFRGDMQWPPTYV